MLIFLPVGVRNFELWIRVESIELSRLEVIRFLAAGAEIIVIATIALLSQRLCVQEIQHLHLLQSGTSAFESQHSKISVVMTDDRRFQRLSQQS